MSKGDLTNEIEKWLLHSNEEFRITKVIPEHWAHNDSYTFQINYTVLGDSKEYFLHIEAGRTRAGEPRVPIIDNIKSRIRAEIRERTLKRKYELSVLKLDQDLQEVTNKDIPVNEFMD